jgi:branched-subunit amino acid ABC-type transport system permease component
VGPGKENRTGDVMPFVIAGLVSGAVYGLAAVGLVLTYKTSGLFNFAHGAMATVSGLCVLLAHGHLGRPHHPVRRSRAA